jgi:pimeloyl-ACP methyl ester carboxylesterase
MAPTESGISLVLIPGLLNTDDLWRDQIKGLADIGNIHVAFQHREHDNIPEIADKILDWAPDRFAVAGLSMGGYVAFEILRQAPERAVALGLLDTSARPETQDRAAQRRETIRVARADGLNRVLEDILPNLLHPEHVQDQDIRQRMTLMAEKTGVDGFELQQNAIMRRADSRPLLPEINCPTLVLCGREDALTPLEHAVEMANGIANSRLVIVDESGHLSAMEQPGTVTRAMREWLTAT